MGFERDVLDQPSCFVEFKASLDGFAAAVQQPEAFDKLSSDHLIPLGCRCYPSSRRATLSVRVRVRAYPELSREVAIGAQQPRLDLDRLERSNLTARAAHFELVEAARLGHDRVLEAADELV